MRKLSMTMILGSCLLVTACSDGEEKPNPTGTSDPNVITAPNEPAPDPSLTVPFARATATWFLVQTPDVDGDGVPELRVTNTRPVAHPQTGATDNGLYFGDDAFRWVSFLSGGGHGPIATDPNGATINLGRNYFVFNPQTGSVSPEGDAGELVWSLLGVGDLDDDGDVDVVVTHKQAKDGSGKNGLHALVLAKGTPLGVIVEGGSPLGVAPFFGLEPRAEEPKADGLRGLAFQYAPPDGECTRGVHHYVFSAAKNGFVVARSDCAK